MVLMTTESAPGDSGGRQAGAGGGAKTRACIRGIPRSARGRGRVARPDATPTGCRARARGTEKYIQDPYQNFKNRVLENRENRLYAEFNSGYNPFVRILIPATQLERRIFFKMFLTSDILCCTIQ